MSVRSTVGCLHWVTLYLYFWPEWELWYSDWPTVKVLLGTFQRSAYVYKVQVLEKYTKYKALFRPMLKADAGVGYLSMRLYHISPQLFLGSRDRLRKGWERTFKNFLNVAFLTFRCIKVALEPTLASCLVSHYLWSVCRPPTWYIFWKLRPRPFHLTKKIPTYLHNYPPTYLPTYVPP